MDPTPVEQFLDLASSTTDGICTTDRAGRITFVNDALAQLVGVDPQAVVGTAIFDYIVGDVRAAWQELVDRGAALPDLGEFELRRPDGTSVPVILGITPLGHRRFDGVLAVVRDITERRRMAAAIAEREAMLSALLANVPGVVYRCEALPDWPMRFISDEAFNLLGWTPEELIANKTLYGSRIHPDDRALVEDTVSSALDGRPFAMRYRLRHRDGSLRWVWERGRATSLATETEPALLEGLVIDISRQVANEEALKESKQQYRSLMEALPGGLVVTQRGVVVFANSTAARLFGVEEDELVGISVLPFVAPVDREQANEMARLTEQIGADAPVARYRLTHPGAVLEVAALSSAISFGGEPATQTFFWDISAEQRARALNAAQERALEAVASNAPLAEVLDVIAAAVTEALPDTATPVRIGDDGRIGLEARTAEEEVVLDHFRRLAALAIEHDRGRRRVAPDEEVDPLTGALARGTALHAIDQLLADRRNAVIGGVQGAITAVLLGLDDFAALTDALGEAVTNEVLRAVAALLGATAEDGLVARIGAATFLVVTEAASEGELDEFAKTLQAAISAPFRAGGHEVLVTASIGAATSVDARDTAASLVASADAALYQAMRAGPNGQRRFDERLRQQATRRVRLEPALVRALDAGEFRVHYQPQIELQTGTVVGVEALIRWYHPTEGVIPPSDFIPIAERNGMIVPIGTWVLEQACCAAAEFREARPERPPFVSVNLSARQLADPALVASVASALESVHLDPALLRLELTETAVMADPVSATMILRDLRALGVRLSIDDFGTGYSSLVYLKRFPVDELKIDRAFVDGVGERSDDTAIVAGVIRLAESLGLSSLAEGVERLEQAQELVRLGCGVAQGFFWSRALPASDIRELLITGVEPVRHVGSPDDDTARRADAALVALVHELRGPLTVIHGYAELLEGATPPAAAVASIRRNTERLDGILQAVDDVNSLDRGSLSLQVRTENLVPVVASILEGFRAADPGVEITCDRDAPDERFVVEIDHSRISQVVSNLLTNALRYGPPAGPVHVRLTREPRNVVCSVIDHGPGISPEVVGAMFRKYARGERGVPGTGLGLYLARGIARAHGGDVVYRRAPTGGAEFRLVLPSP